MATIDVERLQIDTKTAESELNEALSRMRSTASTANIKATLGVDIDQVAKATQAIGNLRASLESLQNIDGEVASAAGVDAMKNIEVTAQSAGEEAKSTFKGIETRAIKMSTDINRHLAKTAKKGKDSPYLINNSRYQKDLIALQNYADNVKNIREQAELGRDGKRDKSIIPSLDRELNSLSRRFGAVKRSIAASESESDAKIALDSFLPNVDNVEDRVGQIRKTINKARLNIKEKEGKDPIAFGSSTALNDAKQRMSEISNSILDMKAKIKNNNLSQEDLLGLKKLESQAKAVKSTVESEIGQIENDLQPQKLLNNKFIAFDKLGNRATEYFNKYQAGIKGNSSLMNEYATFMNKLKTGKFDSISDANVAFSRLRTNVRDAGVEVDGLWSSLKNMFGTRAKSALAGMGVNLIQSSLRELVQNSIAIDTAMTELKKVTDLSDVGYEKFLDGASDRAKKIGASLSETVNATAD